MKKVIFTLVALVASMSMNAQVMKVMKNGEVEATYNGAEYTVVFEEEPAGPDYVEIGGKKWATMNLGATTVAGSLATCAGDYYQWGSVNTLYSSVSWSGTPLSPTFTWKDGKTTGFVNANKEYTANADLLAANDIVAQTLGGGWRMPTKDDFEELHKACTGSTSNSSPTQLYSSTPGAGVYWLAENQTFLSEYSGVAGILYVSTADTSKRVFFPAAGSVLNASFRNGGTYGYYWSSSLYTDNMALAFGLYFKSSYVDLSQFYTRYSGFTVRPVKD